MKKLLFTDLDGTLLDLQTYSSDQVSDAVEKLKKAGVSIIFCSSKTWTEQEFYLNKLNLEEPVIVENGSGIFFPKHTQLKVSTNFEIIHGEKAILLGEKYDKILTALEEAVKTSGADLKYYHNQSLKEIAALTGLVMNAAEKARTRDFSETIFNADLSSESYQLFKRNIESAGFLCIPGSKFVTITGAGCDKGKAVKMLIEFYRQEDPDVISYGIGDSRNDQEMLVAVDHPFLVQKPDGSWAELDVPGLHLLNGIGPKGWNMMADEMLKGS